MKQRNEIFIKQCFSHLPNIGKQVVGSLLFINKPSAPTLAVPIAIL